MVAARDVLNVRMTLDPLACTGRTTRALLAAWDHPRCAYFVTYHHAAFEEAIRQLERAGREPGWIEWSTRKIYASPSDTMPAIQFIVVEADGKACWLPVLRGLPHDDVFVDHFMCDQLDDEHHAELNARRSESDPGRHDDVEAERLFRAYGAAVLPDGPHVRWDMTDKTFWRRLAQVLPKLAVEDARVREVLDKLCPECSCMADFQL